MDDLRKLARETAHAYRKRECLTITGVPDQHWELCDEDTDRIHAALVRAVDGALARPTRIIAGLRHFCQACDYGSEGVQCSCGDDELYWQEADAFLAERAKLKGTP